MSATAGESGNESESTRDVLDQDRFGTVRASDRNGAIQITIPIEQARDLGISGGDQVVVGGSAGDSTLRVCRADAIGFPRD